MTIFREEATSALAGFHGSPLSCSNWNLETFLGGGRKTGESGEKPSELGNNQQQTQPNIHQAGIEPRQTLSPLHYHCSPSKQRGFNSVLLR